jgi:hypothetical protein
VLNHKKISAVLSKEIRFMMPAKLEFNTLRKA